MRIALLLSIGLLGSSCASEKEPSVQGVEPEKGPIDAEQPVKILGRNFRTDVGYTVYFGNVRSPSVTILNDQTIIAEAPMEQDPKTVDVTVYSDDGAAFRIKRGYRFEVPTRGSSARPQPKARY